MILNILRIFFASVYFAFIIMTIPGHEKVVSRYWNEAMYKA